MARGSRPERGSRHVVKLPMERTSSEIILNAWERAEVEFRIHLPQSVANIAKYDRAGGALELRIRPQNGGLSLPSYIRYEHEDGKEVAVVQGVKVDLARLQLGSRTRKLGVAITRADTGEILSEHTLTIKRSPWITRARPKDSTGPV